MRLATLVCLFLIGCGPGIDPLIGTYSFTLTGLDTNTAPNMSTSTPSGTGTVVITSTAAMTGYLVTLAHSDTNSCTIKGTAAEKATSPEITITIDEKCTFMATNQTATATITSGKAVLALKDTRAMDVMTLDVAYSYAGNTFFPFNVNFAGTGKRTYTGTRR